MARAVEAVPERAEATARPCLCESYARVTERSALASARWLGRADQDGALGAAYLGLTIDLRRTPDAAKAMRLFHWSITYLTLLFGAMALDQLV